MDKESDSRRFRLHVVSGESRFRRQPFQDHTHENKDVVNHTAHTITQMLFQAHVSSSGLLWKGTPFQAPRRFRLPVPPRQKNAFSGSQYLLVEFMNQVQYFVHSRTPLLTPLCLSPLTQQHICSSKYTQAHLGCRKER